LFFELLTGEFLFYDDDWVKFFLRVTQGTEVLTADKQAMLDNNPDLIRFFNFILQRKQQYRPSIQVGGLRLRAFLLMRYSGRDSAFPEFAGDADEQDAAVRADSAQDFQREPAGAGGGLHQQPQVDRFGHGLAAEPAGQRRRVHSRRTGIFHGQRHRDFPACLHFVAVRGEQPRPRQVEA
jgi:hypothetical protein